MQRSWGSKLKFWCLSLTPEQQFRRFLCVWRIQQKKMEAKRPRTWNTRRSDSTSFHLERNVFFGGGEANQKSSFTRSLRRPLVKLSGVIHGPSEPALLKLSTYLSTLLNLSRVSSLADWVPFNSRKMKSSGNGEKRLKWTVNVKEGNEPAAYGNGSDETERESGHWAVNRLQISPRTRWDGDNFVPPQNWKWKVTCRWSQVPPGGLGVLTLKLTDGWRG